MSHYTHRVLFFVFALLGGSTLGAANVPTAPAIDSSPICGAFGSPAFYNVAIDAYDIEAGDFDNDGVLDIATVNYLHLLSVLRGNGDGTLAAPAFYEIGDFPTMLVVVDLDNDDFDDLVTVNSGDSNISVLLNNGDGTFAPAVNYTTSVHPLSAATGDFNGDGYADIAVAAYTASNGVWVHLGSGNGTLQTGVNQGVAGGASSIVTADFDIDGKLDLATTNVADDTISTLKGNGDGTFQAPVEHTVDSNPFWLVLGDFNADGKPDLATTVEFTLHVLIGNGDSTFQTPVQYSLSQYTPYVVAEDLNGDGITDLSFAGEVSNNMTIFHGNGNGTFQSATTSYVGFGIEEFTIGDFNADGKPDLAGTSYYSMHFAVVLGGCADLTIEKSHEDDFRGGQSGTYSIVVTNTGTASTNGTVTVTDTLPDGLTASSISGSNWTCTTSPLECTASLYLAPGASYPTITLSVDVSNSAPTNVVNTASVSGGRDANTDNDSDSDPTTIVHGPDLKVLLSHSGNFGQGLNGRTITIDVVNIGNEPSSGTVTLTDTVPAGLTPTAISGTGWTCVLATRTCTRSDALAANAYYPSIHLTVDVENNCPSTVTNTATISGGGDTDSNNNTASHQIPVAGPPTLAATATGSSTVTLTWTATAGVDYYDIFRSTGSGFSYVGSSPINSYADSTVAGDTTYLYMVRSYSYGPFSNVDAATTTVFTDATLQAGVTTIKKAHLTELRIAVNAMRTAAALSAATFTDPTLPATTPVKAIHIADLRNALNAARTALGLPAITYTDPSLAAGMVVKAAHVNDLRNGVK